MEALLEKEGDVENWNDDRLDELSRRMDAGFNAATKKDETNRRFDKVDHELGRVNDRLDRLTYALIFFAISLIGAVAAGGLNGS